MLSRLWKVAFAVLELAIMKKRGLHRRKSHLTLKCIKIRGSLKNIPVLLMKSFIFENSISTTGNPNWLKGRLVQKVNNNENQESVEKSSRFCQNTKKTEINIILWRKRTNWFSNLPFSSSNCVKRTTLTLNNVICTKIFTDKTKPHQQGVLVHL